MTGLVERIRRVFPDAPILVWSFEAYERDPNKVISAFLEDDVGTLSLAEQDSDVQTPSGKAVDEVERHLHMLSGPGRPAEVRGICEAFPTSIHGRFDPLSIAEKKQFRAGCLEDLGRLKPWTGVKVLDGERIGDFR